MVDAEDSAEVVEVGEVTDLMAPQSAGALDRAAIDVQVATAKQFPRSVAASMKEAKELVTLDTETAGTMFYVLPRGGKKIRGPSTSCIAMPGWPPTATTSLTPTRLT